MKSRTRVAPFVVIFLLVSTIVACRKSLSDTDAGTTPTTPVKPKDSTQTGTPVTTKDTATVTPSFPTKTSTHCAGAPQYPDSILYLQQGSGDYIVRPVNNPDTGKYFAWPQGMVIDANTGAINVSKSESGLRYAIGWVKKGTNDTCLQNMILAGVSYEDSLYVLNNDQRYASPYYNADPNNTQVCDPGNGSGGNTCIFDVSGQAAAQNVVVDKGTGVIDLKATASKAFGLIPINGTTVVTTIVYKLNDASNMATQQIQVKFIYYNKKSDVPPDLLAAVTERLNKVLGGLLLINLGNSSQTIAGNPRPPIIIVTRYSL